MQSKELVLVGELCTTVLLTGAGFVDSLSTNHPERTLYLLMAATLIGIDATILAPRRLDQNVEELAKIRKIDQDVSKSDPIAE